MTKLKFLAILAVVSASTATPVLAQSVISEPGAYAFYYPDADLGIGSALSPREAAGGALGQIKTAGAMASAQLRNGGGSHRDREARNRGVRRATARARTNDNSVQSQAYGIEGRQVAAPPWSAACMTDHGPSECGEPMWIYGSHDAIAGYRNAF